jgi:hypothetical protein
MQQFSAHTLNLNDHGDGGGQVLTGYPTYPEAQQATDRLAADSVPVQHSEIIDRDPTPSRARHRANVSGARLRHRRSRRSKIRTPDRAARRPLHIRINLARAPRRRPADRRPLRGGIRLFARRLRNGHHDYASPPPIGANHHRGDGRRPARPPRTTTAQPSRHARDEAMFPALPYSTTAARRDGLYRDTRHRNATEIRIREELRRARQPAVTHHPRSRLSAGH